MKSKEFEGIIRSFESFYQRNELIPYRAKRIAGDFPEDGVFLVCRGPYIPEDDYFYLFFFWISQTSFFVKSSWTAGGKINKIKSLNKGSRQFRNILDWMELSFLSKKDLFDLCKFLNLYAKKEIFFEEDNVKDFFKGTFSENIRSIENRHKTGKRSKQEKKIEEEDLPTVSEKERKEGEGPIHVSHCFYEGADYIRFIARNSGREICRIKIGDNKIEKQKNISAGEDPIFVKSEDLFLWDLMEKEYFSLSVDDFLEISKRNPYMGLLEARNQILLQRPREKETVFQRNFLFYLDCCFANPNIEKIVKANMWDYFLKVQGEKLVRQGKSMSSWSHQSGFFKEFLQEIEGKTELYDFLLYGKETISFGKKVLSEAPDELKDILRDALIDILSLKVDFSEMKKETVYLLFEDYSFFQSFLIRKTFFKNELCNGRNISLEEIVSYLKETSEKEYIEIFHLTSLYSDYLTMILNMGREERKHLGFKIFPEMIRYHHDKAVYYAKVAEDAQINSGIARQKKIAEKNLSFEDKTFRLVFPENTRDLIHESARLGHCVKTYGKKISHGESIIAFIRKKGDLETPFFTMEISPEMNQIYQLKGNGNITPDSMEKKEREELLFFIEGFMKDKQILNIVY